VQEQILGQGRQLKTKPAQLRADPPIREIATEYDSTPSAPSMKPRPTGPVYHLLP